MKESIKIKAYLLGKMIAKKFLLALCLQISATIMAQDGELTIGDDAPPLKVSQWVKGQPIKQFKPGNVYVLEFWATWCRPCLASMPHLSELAKQYKGKVEVIAISVLEKVLKPGKTDAQVAAFVAQQGDKMAFRVATEDTLATVNSWLVRTGERMRGIPSTIIVDGKGKLAWFGHPAYVDTALSQIVDGSWDLKLAANARQEHRRLAALDDSLNYELSQYAVDNPALQQVNRPDLALKMIDSVLKVEPALAYAQFIAGHKFTSLLKTNQEEAYTYGMQGLKSSSYSGTPYDEIIEAIDFMANSIKLNPKIYALSAMAYEKLLENIVYPQLVNMPKIYSRMAEMYWRAGDKVQAAASIKTAVELAQAREGYSKVDLDEMMKRLMEYSGG